MLDRQIERRHGFGGVGHRLGAAGFSIFRQIQTSQAGGQLAGALAVPLQLAGGFPALQVDLPEAVVEVAGQLQGVDRASHGHELVGAQIEPIQRQRVGLAAVAAVSAIAVGRLDQAAPEIGIDARGLDRQQHALIRQTRVRAANGDQAALDHRLAFVVAAHQLKAQHVAQAGRQLVPLAGRRPLAARPPALGRLRQFRRRLAFEHQRQGIGGRLVEGLRQAGGDALQGRFDAHLGGPLLHPDGAGPRRAAGQMLEQRVAILLAQGAHAHAARRPHGDAAVLGRHVERHGHAEHAGAHLPGFEHVAGEMEFAVDVGERRQVGIVGQPVAGQPKTAVNPAVDHAVERQVEPEAQLAIARGDHVLGEMVDALAHRAGFDEAQKIRGRAGGCPGNDQLGLVQVGDLRLGVGYLDAPEFGPLGADDHARTNELQVAGDILEARPAGGIAQAGALKRPLDLEDARAVAIGKAVQVALQAQRCRRRAADDGRAQPVARVLIDHQRHVAPDGGAAGAREPGGQIDLAGTGGQGAIVAAGFAGRVGVVETRLAELDGHARRHRPSSRRRRRARRAAGWGRRTRLAARDWHPGWPVPACRPFRCPRHCRSARKTPAPRLAAAGRDSGSAP